jgi:serine/threonine-protein kinase
MSPEQVGRASTVDERTDIWSLGIVMYELLTNRPAFSGETPQELCLQILNEPLTPLSELRPDLPPALVYIVERCLERDVDKRFQDVAELAEALAPLDDWSPANEAKRIRRRLEMNAPQVPISERKVVVHATPVPTKLPSKKPSKRPSAAPTASRRRRIASAVFVVVALIPVVAILPTLLRAPELAPARAWSSQAVGAVQGAMFRARDVASDLWAREADGNAAAPSSP